MRGMGWVVFGKHSGKSQNGLIECREMQEPSGMGGGGIDHTAFLVRRTG